MAQASTHIMFQGDAAAALDFYAEHVPDFKITARAVYGPEAGPNTQGVMRADVDFAGQHLIIIDSPIPHDFDLTPSMSLFLTLRDEHTLRSTFAVLAEGGRTLMPLDNYGFSPLFGWVQDRFGLSWQLAL